MIKLTKKAFEFLDAVPYSRKGLGYAIGGGLDVVLPYWFSCYFDQGGKLMKALLVLCQSNTIYQCFNMEYVLTSPEALSRHPWHRFSNSMM
jgi:hypothetical protein